MKWQEAAKQSPVELAVRYVKRGTFEERRFYRSLDGTAYYVYRGLRAAAMKPEVEGHNDWEPVK